MQLTALRVGMCCAALTLLVSGCESSGTSEPTTDGGGNDAALPIDGPGAVQDLALPTPDTREVGLAAEVRGPDLVVDVTGEAPNQDGPGTNVGEGGAGAGFDGPGAEVAGGNEFDAPQSFPDGGGVCGLAGAACGSAADCCGLACVAGHCSTAACLSDGQTCTSPGECCSTVCGAGGTCVPLNPSCKTAGNTCASDAECCSKVCNASHQCAPPSEISYCAQPGDVCQGDTDCCTGVCAIAAGASVGTCAIIATGCLVDGTVCNGCGSCCSHFCGPFGVGGPDICQPASGCHVQGDLCHADSDCCGGDVTSGLPGAGLVKCEPDPVYGSRIGTCGNPRASNCPGADTCKNTCIPEGNVCHFKETAVCGGDLTNVNNNCCECVSSKDCCQLDATGIPRCNGLAACVPTGGACSFSGDCCDREPCLPDPATGKLTCGSKCVELGQACTTNADCCTGMLCNVPPGALAGTCTIPQPPSTLPDAGAPDGGQPDAPPICSYFGQPCSVDLPCCGGTSCVNDSFADCTPTDTDCVCFSPE
jgi:hypothetical protein